MLTVSKVSCLRIIVALSSIALVIVPPGLHVFGQTNQCTTDRNIPSSRGAAFAWPQNALVNVNINSNQFSQADFGCLQRAFENWNLANEASGNSSGVRFRLNHSPTVIAATVGGTAETAPTSAAPAGYVYQVNRPQTLEGDNPGAFGQTGTGGTGEYRTSAVTNLNSQITDCDALTMAIAHEIGHTLGLGECPSCDPRGSVMVGGTAVRNPDGSITRLYNDTSSGRVGPTPCDDQVVRQGVGYNPATVNQPSGTGGSGGGGGGDGGGGGGGDSGGGCTEYWWVEYSCSEEEGRLWRRGIYTTTQYPVIAKRHHPKPAPEMSCVEVGRWYAGCW